MVPPDSLEERTLDIANCDAVELRAPPDTFKKKAMIKAYLASRKCPLCRMVDF